MNATKTTISRKAIEDQIKKTVLNSYVQTGWHAVRVSPTGDVYGSHEPSACYSHDEYYRRVPHTVTIWESGNGTGCMNQEELGECRESEDWGAWFESNLDDLEEKLEPTGLELVD